MDEDDDVTQSAIDRLSRYESEGLAPRWFAVLFFVSAVALGTTLLPFVADGVLALILVATFGGLHGRLTDRLRGRAWLASALVTLLLVVLVAGPLAGLVATVVDEAQEALQSTSEVEVAREAAEREEARQEAEQETQQDAIPAHTPSMAVQWTQRLLRAVHVSGVRVELLEQLEAVSTAIRGVLLDQLSSLVNDALAAIFHFAIILVLVFYLFVDAPRLKRFLFELSPLPDDEEEMLVATFNSVSRGILVGNGIGSALQGLLGGLAIVAVGGPAPVLWGTVMAVFAFLPLVGISVIVLPITIYLWLTDQHAAAIFFVVFCTAQGVFIENVVKTKLIGKRTRMHDLLVLLSILGGIATFGILGLLYGPLIATAFLSLNELYRRKYRRTFADRYVRREELSTGG